jgi:hypothetical protein
MTIQETRHTTRADAGQHVKHILEREAAAIAGLVRRPVSIGHLGGFPVSAEVYQSLGSTHITITLDGAPGAAIELPASDLRSTDPAGLVTRLENRLTQLEARKATALADSGHARRQITHARTLIPRMTASCVAMMPTDPPPPNSCSVSRLLGELGSARWVSPGHPAAASRSCRCRMHQRRARAAGSSTARQ